MFPLIRQSKQTGNCSVSYLVTPPAARPSFCRLVLLPRSFLLLPLGPTLAARSSSCHSALLLPLGPTLAARSSSRARFSYCHSVLLLQLGPLPASPWLRCHFQRNGRRSFPGSGGQHLQIPGPQITVTFTGKHNRTRQVTTRLTSWQINTRLNWQAKNKLDSSNETVLD